MEMPDREKLIDEYYSSYEDEKRRTIAKPRLYVDLYNKYFSELFDKKVSLLELGIYDGNSLEYFSKLFPNANVFGIDLNKCDRMYSSDRIKMYQGSQDNKALYEKIIEENKIDSFDIVIDDCSHVGSLTLSSFKIIHEMLSPGGFYVIEDWGTGYNKDYPGGKRFDESSHLKCKKILPHWMFYIKRKIEKKVFKKKGWGFEFNNERFDSHPYGIPGVIKQLMDEAGLAISNRSPLISYLHVYPGIVIMQKST